MIPDAVPSPSALIADKKIRSVSFPLFGTLLMRRAIGIEGLFERTLQLAPVPERVKQIADSFIQHRTLAQNRLRIGRDSQQSVALVSGVSIDDIYAGFAVHALGLSPDIRPLLVAAELAAEKELAIFNPESRGLIEQARRAGKRIGVVAESHWSPEQIRQILAAAAPDLAMDFIYSSASADNMSRGGLFRAYLAGESLRPAQALHIGIDQDTVPHAIKGLRRAMMPAVFDGWDAEAQRELAVARLLRIADGGFDWRLDGGLHLLRGIALGKMQVSAPHHRVAAAVLGPLMVGFQHHIAQRMAELSQDGRRVKLTFLARDGYLPMRCWQASGAGAADYIELNRRIAMVAGTAGAGGLSTVQGLFQQMEFLRPSSVEDFFKIKLNAKTRAFFAQYPNELCPGPDFADAMPRLLGRTTLNRLSETLRAALLHYLTVKLGPLDQVTDIILADIGYTGNIQRGLRRVFDLAGLTIRIHGLYLMPHGEAFVDLPDQDSVSGYLDDTVLTPWMKRAVMRDAPLLEEFCCAPVGSTKGYIDGREIRETDVRLPREIGFCLEMQDETIRFFDEFRAAMRRYNLNPLQDFARFRGWTASILARFVMMPTQLECQTFGPLLHDVSLGSKALIATITTADIANLMAMLPFPAVCSIHHPPVWLGGSLSADSAIAGTAYAMVGMGLPIDDLLRDVEVGDGEAVLVKGERVLPLPVSRFLTPFGDLRLRMPVLQKDGDCVIALPLRGPLEQGVIRAVMLQGGKDIAEATTTRHGDRLKLDRVEASGALLQGKFFRATAPEGMLLFQLPGLRHPVAVLTVLLTPLLND